MKILREGGRGKALAPGGRGWIPVTYRYRTVRLEESGVDVPNVLVGVDDETDEILVIPGQSAPKLKAARDKVKSDVLQVKIPHELDDILGVLADHFEAAPQSFPSAVLRFYLSEASESPRLAGRLAKLSASPWAKGQTGRKLSIRTTARFKSRINEMSDSLQANASDLARGAIVAAKQDLLDGRNKSRTRKLEAVAKAI